jgi:hypothetical protein
MISKLFDGRSENNVKNRWYTHLQGRVSSVDVGEAPVLSSPVQRRLLPSITTLSPDLLLSATFSPQDTLQAILGSSVHAPSPFFIPA